MMAAILNSAMLDSAILDSAISSQTHSTLAKISSQHLHKKTSLIHSNLTWWWQLSWNLPFSIQPFCHKDKLHSFILTHLDDGSWSWNLPFLIQPFCTKKTFTHSFSLNLIMAAILNSAMFNLASLDSAILVFLLKLISQFCFRDHNYSSRFNQQYEKSTQSLTICQDWFPPFA